MTDKPTTSTVLFADICRSTYLFDQLGDEAALALIVEVLQATGQIALQCHGDVIGTIGDEVLCLFGSSEDAFLAANQIHKQVQQNTQFEKHQLAMRVGIHKGTVVKSDGNIWGDTVNIAARLAQLAKAHQSLTTANTIVSISASLNDQIRPLGQLSLRGKPGMIDVYELLTFAATEEITDVAAITKISKRSFLLVVRFQTRQMRFDPLLTRFLFGRSMGCDQVVDHPTISREHAEILYRDGQFIFRDFSTNGSYVVQDNKIRQFRRAGLELKGRGKIYLGQTLHNQKFCLEFNCPDD